MKESMPDKDIIYLKEHFVATIVFNRPQSHNALTPEMLCRLADALIDAQNDDNVRAIVLTGAGDKAFCAGGDLGVTLPLLTGARAPADIWDERLLSEAQVRSLSSLCDPRLNKPIIAAVNGICMAAGAELLLGTDIRVASSGAVFAWPEVQHGLIPFAGSLSRLPAQVPYCQAMELMLTGEAISATKALELGLLNYVKAPPEVLPLAQKLAQKIAANGPAASREIKTTARGSMGMTEAEAFKLEKDSYSKIMATEDAREGPRAFIERRSPKFTGK